MFDNAWWRDKNTNRQPGGSLWDQTGAVAKGFGKHLATNLVPYEMGEKGIQARKGYNPMNLMNIGMMGLRDKNQFTYDKKGNEYRAGFGDFIGNVTNDITGQMMQREKLNDMLLSRQLRQAKIGSLERKNLMPEMFKWDEMVDGKRVTRQLIMEGGKSKVVTVDKDAPLTSKMPGTVTGKHSFVGEDGIAMIRTSVLQDDGVSVKSYDVVDPSGLKALHTNRQSALVNINALNTANQESAKTGEDMLGPAIKKSMYAVIADKEMDDPKRFDMYKEVSIEYFDKVEQFESAKQFTGVAQPKESPNQPARYKGGLYEEAEQYAKNVTNFGWVGAINRLGDKILNFGSIQHNDSDATKFNTIIDAIKFRANSMKAATGGLKISSRLMDTQKEKEWLSELSGLDIKKWTANPRKAQWNIEMLKKVEREAQGRRAKSMAMTVHGASQIPWLKKQDELMGGRMFSHDPTGQYKGGWQGNVQ